MLYGVESQEKVIKGSAGKERIIIIGGIAAGTAAAAKCRRTDEGPDIVIYEKDDHISYGTCGLPYFVSGKIQAKRKLLVNTPKLFSKRFNVDVRTGHEVLKIVPGDKKLIIRDMESGREFEDHYDRLIITTGSDPIKIPLDGYESGNVFTLKTIRDADRLKDYLSGGSAPSKSAVIIGGGFIGLELVEAFMEHGLRVTVIEKMDQLLPAFDREIMEYLENYLGDKGIDIIKNEEASVLARGKGGLVEAVETKGGRKIEAGLVFFGIGVRPNAGLASECGIETGDSGAIAVDSRMRTSIADIYAAGDCCECRNMVSGSLRSYNLASIANRQGRTAGYNAAGGEAVFSESNITSIVKVLDVAVGKTGLGYREAKDAGYDAGYIELHYNSHAGYYPGAEMMHCLAVYDKESGKLLGMQAIGKEGIDKRIDVISASIKNGMKIKDLQELDLSYQPAYGSARDALNILGMIGDNLKKGDISFVNISKLKQNGIADDTILLDVRSEKEFAAGHIEGAVNINIDDLRDSLDRLDRDMEILLYCKTGYRAYLGARLLANEGFNNIRLLNGSFLSWNRKI